MRAITCQRIVIIVLCIGAVSMVRAADFHEGLAAYNRGDYDAAIREWSALAEQGDAESQYRLARMYYHGEGVRDDAAAARWYRTAAEQNHLLAQNNLGLLYQEGRGVEQDDASAVEWYRKAAEQGLATAQGNLGRMYDAGRGVVRDLTTAARWYRKAAEQGHVGSQYRLAVMYDEGAGLVRDTGKAVKWYHRAAKQGHGPAQNAIGTMYAEGRGVSRNLEKATKWLSRASAQGIAVTTPVFVPPPADEHPESEPVADVVVVDEAPDPVVDTFDEPTERGVQHEPPPPVVEPAPVVEPVSVGRPASQRSKSEPEFLVSPELREVGRRAEEGDVTAQYRLAQMYSTGQGAPQSLDDAARWFLAAAEQGHELAAYKLAFLYLRGRGVAQKDFVEAHRWFSVSAALGVGDAATWRDKIRRKMTDKEIAESERLLGGARHAEE